MSDGISLSQELITDLLQRIGQHDASAQQDMMVNLQYLVAVTGYLAADYPGSADERNELLEHLHAFTKHVCDERAQSNPAQQPAAQANPAAAPDSPAGKSEPTNDPAVGIWKPD